MKTALTPDRVEWDERAAIDAPDGRRASLFWMPSSKKYCWSTGFGLTNVGFGYEREFAAAEKHCLAFMKADSGSVPRG